MQARHLTVAQLRTDAKYYSKLAEKTTRESSPDIYELLSYYRSALLVRGLNKPKLETATEEEKPFRTVLAVVTENNLSPEAKLTVQKYKEGKFKTKVLYIRALAEHGLSKNQITKLTGFYYSQVHEALK